MDAVRVNEKMFSFVRFCLKLRKMRRPKQSFRLVVVLTSGIVVTNRLQQILLSFMTFQKDMKYGFLC